jgi:NADH:ubiquinone oxidoreductase subunit 5 (subunit L)/multisubunit Na+/H+ antiporter MnhA subunit
MFDPLAVVMLVVVSTISFCVQLYSFGYMGEDPHLRRFYSFLSLFTFFMLVLVTADNYVLLFLG